MYVVWVNVHPNLKFLMEKLSEKFQEDIKKMSTSRLKLKLLSVGYSDDDVESFDRPTCIEKWADIVGRGLDQPLPTTPQQSTGYDVELERERLKWEQHKFEEEMKVKARELALKEQEVFQAIKIKQDELELQKQKIELENNLVMQTKRFSDALKGALIKMSSDPVEVAGFFRQLDSLYAKFEVPVALRATLLKPYLNDKAKLIVARLDPCLADKYESVKEAILREFKTTPSYLLNKFKTVTKDSNETYILYGSKLMTLLDYYLDSRNVKDFKNLVQLLVCDRIKAVLDDACLKHILTLENSTIDGWLKLTDLTTAIDKYYANCVGGPKKTTVASPLYVGPRLSGPVFTPRGWSPGTIGNNSLRNPNGFGNRPQLGSIRRCFECNSPDHLRAYCPRVRANSNVGDTTQHKHNQPGMQSQDTARSQIPKPNQRIEPKQATINRLDTRVASTVPSTTVTENVKQINQSVINPNLGDLQYIDVILSDGSGESTEVVQAVVDSGAEMCVVRQDVIAALDCLTVGKVTLRGIVGDPFNADVKRVYIGAASDNQVMFPVACACHEAVHDKLLLTPAVVNCLISNDPINFADQNDTSGGDNNDNESSDDVDVNVDNDNFHDANEVGGNESNNHDQQSPDVSHAGESVTENHAELSDELCVSSVSSQLNPVVSRGDVIDQSGLTTAVEPDTLQFVDILPTTQENKAESRRLSEEQKQDESLNQWWKMAEENKNGFFVQDNVLFRNERILGHSFKQLCVPQSRRKVVLDLAHNSVGAHMGVKRTRERILFSFTWPGLRADVRDYVRTCPACQKHARITYQDRVPIKAIELDARPFRVWFVDVLGPLFQDNTEFKYAVVMVDSATRFPFARAIRAPSAKNVCDAILEIWQFTGIGAILVSDNGTHFTSELNKEFLKRLGCAPRFITQSHPNANGLCERMVGTIKRMLSKVAMEHPKSWHKHLGYILWALREVSNESTCVPPWVLAFGFLPRGPLAILQESWCDEQQLPPNLGKTPHAYLVELRDHLEKAQEYASQHVENAQQRYVHRYNLRSCEKTFVPGEKVLILKKDTTSSKTFSSWIGPGEIIEVRSPSSYLVEVEGARKVYHTNHLRKYHIRIDRAQCDNLCFGFPQDNSSANTINTCAVVYEQDNDFGKIDVIEPVQSESNGIDSTAEQLPSQKITSEALAHLSKTKQKQLLAVLDRYPQCFSDTPGYTEEAEHCIPLMPGFVPKRMQAYKVPEKLKSEVEMQVQNMLKQGIIELSQSPMASPLVCILKGKEGKDGVRLAVDFRYVNKYTIGDAYPMSDVADIKQRVGSKRWITVVDAKSGYWQTPVKPEDRWLTAFVYNDGLYQFRRTPFGLKSSGATFVRALKKILQPVKEFTDSYVDDMAAFSDEWRQHLVHLDLFLQNISEAHITLNLKKCKFAHSQVKFCGEIIGSCQRRIDPEKIEVVEKIQAPSNKTELRQILGLFSFFRDYIPRFAEITQSLTDLTKKGIPNKIPWSEMHQQTLDKLKQVLSDAAKSNLTIVDFNKPFDVFVDASEKSVSGILTQQDTNKHYAPIAFFSQKLNDTQRKWSTIEREAYAVVVALQKYRSWLFRSVVRIHSDHNPLTYLTSSAPRSAKLMRWALALQEFQVEFRYRKGENNLAADCLSRLDID